MDRKINIISITIPWPANYGGVIDIYYKVKALYDCGIKVILHCFEYDRPRTADLERVCEKVYYYRRQTGIAANMTFLPYNVYGRKDSQLIGNLLKNDFPILFEGLHTCYYINDNRLKNRFKIFRQCNIEHHYYKEIGRVEGNIFKKCFFYIEAQKFKCYLKKVADAELMAAVSTTDTEYLRCRFPHNRVEFIPCFHGNDKVVSTRGKSDFLLYHGKLSVKENEKAALFLIEHVFNRLSSYRCVVAGMNPSKRLRKAASQYKNIEVQADPSVEQIDELIRTAQINLLVTFQDTGLKLKLLNSLFAGRHVVVNPMMLTGNGLDELCHISNTPEEIVETCKKLMEMPFSSANIENRQKLLFPVFSNKYQAERLIELVYGESK